MTKHALKHLRSDPVMAQLIERAIPVDFNPRRHPPFQSLIHAIIHQQLSGKAAATILGRFQALFGNGAFPTPEQILQMSSDRIRASGLSRAKANYVRDIAERARNGLVPTLAECDAMSDAEIITRLTEINGVGRWTVEMLLIFNLGRPDVLPVHDLGVRRGFQIAYRKRKLPAPEQLERHGAKWAPYRSTATWYLWRAVELGKNRSS